MQAIIRSNLHCGDLETFFSGQWSDHASSQSMGQWTDMQLVGREGVARVQVHRAVILPLCPFLAWMDNDMTGEDLVIILPEYPLELLQGVTNLIYKGSTSTSTVVTVDSVLEVMANLGLHMPSDRLLLAGDHRHSGAGLVGYPPGLDTCEVNNNSCFNAVGIIRRSPELPPTPLVPGGPPSPKRRCLSKIVQTPSLVKKTTKAKKKQATDRIVYNEFGNDDLVILKDPAASVHLKVPVSKSVASDQEGEFNKDVMEDLQVTKKRIKRYSETLDSRKYNCELCEHRCRFLKDLQEHLDLAHSDLVCSECVFKSSSLAVMKTHRKKKHAGVDHASGKGVMKSKKKKGMLKDGDKIENRFVEAVLADAALLLVEGFACDIDIRKRSEPKGDDIDELLGIEETDLSNQLNPPQNFYVEAENENVMLGNIEDLIKEIKNTELCVEDEAKEGNPAEDKSKAEPTIEDCMSHTKSLEKDKPNDQDVNDMLCIPITSDHKVVEATAEASSIITAEVAAREAFDKHTTGHPAAASLCSPRSRLLAKAKPSGSSSSGRTRREKRGSCPMCGRELGMKMLENHAAWCNGK